MADNSHIIILPDDPTLLTDANRQMLRNPDFFTPHAPTAKTEFPIIELDTPNYFQTNRDAVRAVCQGHSKEAPVLIGAPGVSELHLPIEYAPLRRLAAKVATIADESGILAQECIGLTVRHHIRPTMAPYWHTDLGGIVLLICSSDAGTAFSLPCVQANQNYNGYNVSQMAQYSVMPGLPLCFAGIQHTVPYNDDPNIKRDKSGVVLFFNFKAGQSEVDLKPTSEAVRRAYLKAGGPSY